MKIGQRIKNRREELGLSQEELAHRMGYKTRNAIYQYEQVDNMKLSLVEKFAKALDCSKAYLMGWEESQTLYEGYKEEINSTMLRNALPKDEQELLSIYRSLSDEEKRMLLLMLNYEFKKKDPS